MESVKCMYSPSPLSEKTCISFVIPVRNDATNLNSCLSSIQALELNGFSVEIIVGDNGSTDASRSVAERYGSHVIELPGLKVAQVRNRAAYAASGALLAFVDADHILDRGWLKAAVSAISESGAGAVGSPYRKPVEATWVQEAYDCFRTHPISRHDTDWLGCGNLLVRRDVFISIGGFDNELETCEDVDLCQRIRQAGWRVLAEPGMKNIHIGDPGTLKALFFGELWRGRDNAKVTLRGPLTIRSFASLLIPSINLFLTIIALVALVLIPFRPALLFMLATCLVGYISLSLIRTFRMSQNTDAPSFVKNFTVASVYELARSLALVFRSTHSIRSRHQSITRKPDKRTKLTDS